MVVPGIDGETAPQLFDSFQPEFIIGVHKFDFDPLKIVDEHASPETVTQVAIKLLEYLEGLSGSGDGELFMLFAYDLGGLSSRRLFHPWTSTITVSLTMKGDHYCIPEETLQDSRADLLDCKTLLAFHCLVHDHEMT